MKARHKAKETVYVFGATYLHHYDDHVGGKGTIVTVNKEEDWKRPLVPDYIIKIGRKKYLIPQVDIDETGTLKKKYS